MELVTKSSNLSRKLCPLLDDCRKVSFAVAWAGIGHDVWKHMQVHCEKIHRAVIGTHFYQTAPEVLEAFEAVTSVRFMLPDNRPGVFHPKVYLFHCASHREMLIGSANLTNGAFNTNDEMMLHLTDNDSEANQLFDQLISQIDEYWGKAKRLNNDTIAKYKCGHEQHKPQLKQLSGQYSNGQVSKPDLGTRILSMNLGTYADEVRKDPYHNVQGRCDLLDIAHRAFTGNTSFKDMSDDTRKLIAGLPNSVEPDKALWFGSMKGAGSFWHKINVNDAQLAEAIDYVPLGSAINKATYLQYVEYFRKAFNDRGDGLATATRLLAIKRPDQFICLDSKNMAGICSDFGIKKLDTKDYERYWDDIILRVRNAPWWNAKRPTKDTNNAQRIWDGRAAMVDAIFYEE